jgi:hypothetical protein
VGDTPPFASTREALGMLRTVLGYLGAGASEMAAQAQAECLQELEQLDAVKTATRAEILGASPPRRAIPLTVITVPGRG